jgi:uncharacterized protein YciI
MTYFAVTRERGRSWDASLGMREQEKWDEHAAFMDALADDGFVVLGGPLDDGKKVLLIIDAESEQEIVARLGDDPWTPMGLLRILRVLSTGKFKLFGRSVTFSCKFEPICV